MMAQLARELLTRFRRVAANLICVPRLLDVVPDFLSRAKLAKLQCCVID
jgi:hypothetical protein